MVRSRLASKTGIEDAEQEMYAGAMKGTPNVAKKRDEPQENEVADRRSARAVIESRLDT